MKRIGIIGAGHIAEKMSRTVSSMTGVETYAVASRTFEKADQFAAKWGYEKAYGSYEELCQDPKVDLIYVATTHSHHLSPVLMALSAGKAVLCEKTLAMNGREAREMVEVSKKTGSLLCEAAWTRFLPLSQKIKELIEGGAIGEPMALYANLSYPVIWKPRLQKAELGGGALLDLGTYCLHFARMYFGDKIESVDSSCILGGENNGVDVQETISLRYANGRMACLQSSAVCASGRTGMICGTEGYLTVDNVNCPELVSIFDKNHALVEEFRNQGNFITGFEFEVQACLEAAEKGLIETQQMPHSESIAIIDLMDSLRKSWGVVFPND